MPAPGIEESMSNKLEATFHGPPPDDNDPPPPLDDTLPIRQPQDVLTHWDDYWTGRARQVREAPPWVAARRRAPLVIPDEFRPHWTGGTQAPPPPPPPPPTGPPPGPHPAWFVPALAGAAGFLFFFGMLALVLALGQG